MLFRSYNTFRDLLSELPFQIPQNVLYLGRAANILVGMLQPSETQAYLTAGAQIVGINANALPQVLIDQGDWAGLADAARALRKEVLGEMRVSVDAVAANGAQKV